MKSKSAKSKTKSPKKILVIIVGLIVGIGILLLLLPGIKTLLWPTFSSKQCKLELKYPPSFEIAEDASKCSIGIKDPKKELNYFVITTYSKEYSWALLSRTLRNYNHKDITIKGFPAIEAGLPEPREEIVGKRYMLKKGTDVYGIGYAASDKNVLSTYESIFNSIQFREN